MTSAERRWAYAVGGGALVGLVGLGILWAIGPGLITEAYQQKPGALLGGLISGQGRFPLDGYLLFFQRTVIALACSLAIAGAVVPWLLGWNARGGRGAVGARAGWIALAVFAVTIVGLRARTFDEAQDRDLAAYMTVADGMLHGKTLYQQVWDHKPPAIHMTYAASSALFGPTQLALWMMGVSAALVTLVACYRAGLARGGVSGGIAAAAVWTLASGDLLLQANQPNAEVFQNAAMAWAFVLIATPAPRSALRWMVIGALYLWASLYKPVVVAIAGLVVVADALNMLRAAPADEPLPRRVWRVAQGPLVAGVTAGLGWALVFGYFKAVGRFAEFQDAVFAYNRDYAGSMGANLMASLVPTGAVIWTAAAWFPLLVVVALAALWYALRAEGDDARLLLAYLAGAWIAVALPGRLYPHYYQLLLPPLAIGTGWLIARVLAARATVGLVTVAAALTLALTTRVYQSTVTADETPNLKFGGYGFDLRETQRMGPWVAAHVPAGGVLYHWGPEPGVYFFAGQRTPVPWVYNMPVTDNTPRAQRYTAQLMAQLEARPPDLIVASRRELRAIDHPVESWMEQRYRAVDGPAGVDRFVFLVPKGEAGAATAAKD